MEKFFEKVEENCFFKSLGGSILKRGKERHSGQARKDKGVSCSRLMGVRGTEKEKHERPNGSSYQGQSPRTVLVPNKKKPAFTLAEVLITIGIIGIVAAMTIPNLITNYQKKQTALEVKKAYTELNQILKMAIADYGEPGGWDYYKANELPLWVQTYFEPYVKVSGAETCSNYKRCLGVPMYYPLKSTTWSANLNGQYVVAKLGSPFAYVFSRYNGIYETDTRVRAYIRNPRNLRAYVGKDVFTFVLSTKEEEPTFKPYGIGMLGGGIKKGSRTTLLGTSLGGCNPKASGSGYWTPGDACAAVIMLDGWKINKDYPW